MEERKATVVRGPLVLVGVLVLFAIAGFLIKEAVQTFAATQKPDAGTIGLAVVVLLLAV
jgi:hypothetical protein